MTGAMNWLAAAALAIALGFAGEALAQSADPPAPEAAPPSADQTAPDETPEAEGEPEPSDEPDFRPSERVPPGSSVSFPVDI